MASNPLPTDLHLPRIWIQPFYKSFNGLRGFAVSLVFLSHYALFWGIPWLANFTWEGVDLFFVLSGFLITGILYDSLHAPHYFRSFYIRRALRIFPIFYGFFLLLFVLTPILHLRYTGLLLFYVAYVGNLTTPLVNLARHNPTIITVLHHGSYMPIANIGHLWSLCVEEQFYLLWPAVLWFVRDRRKLLRLCAVLIAATFLLRVGIDYLLVRTGHNLNGQNLVLWATFTRCDTLLIGAWMALWLRGNAISRHTLRRLSSRIFLASLAAIALGAFLSAPGMRGPRGPFLSTVGFTLVALASAALILRCLDDGSRVARLFQLRPLSALGVISYGFYFFHDMFRDLWFVFRNHHPQLGWAIPLLAFASTLLVAACSFRFFESPFLRLKKRLAPQRASGESLPAHLHVSVPRVGD